MLLHKKTLTLTLALFMAAFVLNAQNDVELKTKQDSISYAIGMDIGMNISQQNIDLIPEIMAKGLIHQITGNNILLSEEVKFQIINDFQAAHMQKMQEEAKQQAEENKEAGIKFLEANKKEEGVKVTESGLQYRILEEGSGQKPSASSTVTVHYEGKLIDGTVFDSSYQRGEPISFPLSGVIAGWTEGLQLMKVGGKAELFIPYTLGYGEQGAGNIIPGYATLIFTVELLEIED